MLEDKHWVTFLGVTTTVPSMYSASLTNCIFKHQQKQKSKQKSGFLGFSSSLKGKASPGNIVLGTSGCGGAVLSEEGPLQPPSHS